MEDKYVAFESISKEGNEIASNGGDYGWKTVTSKRPRKVKPSAAAAIGGEALANGNSKIANGGDNVFRSLEEKAEDRRRRIVEAQREANGVANGRSKVRSDDESGSEDDDEIAAENGKADAAAVKKPKVKKPKKPKVTLSEASAKIDVNELSAFLAEISVTYETQQELRLMRFADHFGRAFSGVSPAQFPWMKLLRESTVAKMVDIPLSNISEDVYKTSIDWINQHSVEALGSFVLWSLESLLVEFAAHNTSAKGSKKVVQHVSSKSQVGIFVVIAMVLRRKPDALIHVLPKLREDSKYQGQDKIPLLVWITLQASLGDLGVGLCAWARNLLPLVGGRTSNPQTRDLVLQLVERILSTPKARTILVNGAVRKGERLIPPSSFEILMRVTFPSSSARVKATERFEAIYPTLKDVSLAGSQGSKAMKQVSQQILSFAIKDVGESTPELAKEASGVFIWCLTQNADNFKQWDKLYEDNIEASVVILKKLSEQWKDISAKLNPLDPIREVLKSFRNKNEKAMGDKHALFKEADKYCKVLLGKLSRGNGCLKSMAFLIGLGALVAGASVVAPNLESFDWNKLSETFSSAF